MLFSTIKLDKNLKNIPEPGTERAICKRGENQVHMIYFMTVDAISQLNLNLAGRICEDCIFKKLTQQ